MELLSLSLVLGAAFSLTGGLFSWLAGAWAIVAIAMLAWMMGAEASSVWAALAAAVVAYNFGLLLPPVLGSALIRAVR